MTATSMKILVAGANGHTGTYIVNMLKERGHHPLAMLRNREQTEKFERENVKTVVANLEDEQSLQKAVEGTDAVIFAAGSGSKTGPEKTIDVDQNGAIRLVDVAQKAGVSHFIMLSSMGADPNSESERIQHYLRAKGKADEYLQKSNLPYTIVRPGRLTHDQGTGKIQLSEKLEQSGTITREDVARVIVSSLEFPNTAGKTFDILNGEVPIEKALETI